MAKSKHDYYGQRNSEAVSKLHLTAPGTFVMKTSILISANTSVLCARQETWLSWYARSRDRGRRGCRQLSLTLYCMVCAEDTPHF